MAYVAMEELLKGTQGNVYKLVIMAARRALELSAGSEKLIDALPNKKLTSVALEEIKKGKISFKNVKKS